jgi:hypothetical protein
MKSRWCLLSKQIWPPSSLTLCCILVGYPNEKLRLRYMVHFQERVLYLIGGTLLVPSRSIYNLIYLHATGAWTSKDQDKGTIFYPSDHGSILKRLGSKSMQKLFNHCDHQNIKLEDSSTKHVSGSKNSRRLSAHFFTKWEFYFILSMNII